MGATRKIRKRCLIPEEAGGFSPVFPGCWERLRKLARNRTHAGTSEYGSSFFGKRLYYTENRVKMNVTDSGRGYPAAERKGGFHGSD